MKKWNTVHVGAKCGNLLQNILFDCDTEHEQSIHGIAEHVPSSHEYGDNYQMKLILKDWMTSCERTIHIISIVTKHSVNQW